MHRKRALAVFSLVAALAVQPAWASGRGSEGGAKPTRPGTHVEMPILVAPIVIDGKLTAYAYVSSTIVANSPASAIEIRAKVPFIQDVFVRDVNSNPMIKVPAEGKIDEGALKARLLSDARRIVGTEKAVSIIFTQVQVSPQRLGGS